MTQNTNNNDMMMRQIQQHPQQQQQQQMMQMPNNSILQLQNSNNNMIINTAASTITGGDGGFSMESSSSSFPNNRLMMMNLNNNNGNMNNNDQQQQQQQQQGGGGKNSNNIILPSLHATIQPNPVVFGSGSRSGGVGVGVGGGGASGLMGQQQQQQPHLQDNNALNPDPIRQQPQHSVAVSTNIHNHLSNNNHNRAVGGDIQGLRQQLASLQQQVKNQQQQQQFNHQGQQQQQQEQPNQEAQQLQLQLQQHQQLLLQQHHNQQQQDQCPNQKPQPGMQMWMGGNNCSSNHMNNPNLNSPLMASPYEGWEGSSVNGGGGRISRNNLSNTNNFKQGMPVPNQIRKIAQHLFLNKTRDQDHHQGVASQQQSLNNRSYESSRPLPATPFLLSPNRSSGTSKKSMTPLGVSDDGMFNHRHPYGPMVAAALSDDEKNIFSSTTDEYYVSSKEYHNQQSKNSRGMTTTTTKNRTPRPRATSFPEKLMSAMLESTDEAAAAWLPDGKSFVIVNPDLFCEEVVTKIGGNKGSGSKYSSFVRKLHRWGFVRLTSGTGTDCFHHPLFQKHRKEMCAKIKPVPPKIDKHGNKSTKRKIRPPSLNGVDKFIQAKVAAAAAMAAAREEERKKTTSLPSSVDRSSAEEEGEKEADKGEEEIA